MADSSKSGEWSKWWLVGIIPAGLIIGGAIRDSMNPCLCNQRTYRVETDRFGNRIVIATQPGGAEIREGQANAPGYNPSADSSAADPRNRGPVSGNPNDASFNV